MMLGLLVLLNLSKLLAALHDNSKNVFVVAGYNEDLRWLDPIANKTILYNKGLPIEDEELANMFLEVRSLPNVGRESHAYLTYVIDNYNNLPDVITFSQARITNHGHHEPLRFLLELTEQAKEFGGSKNYDLCYINNFNASYVNNPGYPLLPDNQFKDFKSFMMHFFGYYEPEQKVYWNGIFSVRKEKILLRSRQFYESIIKAIDYHKNPLEGHFFERAWNVIFNIDK